MTQPHTNEPRFYRYPMNRLVAVLDDQSALDAALRALRDARVDRAGVVVLSGPDGARRLDRSGKRHGLGARLLRLLQMGTYEGDALDMHELALADGRHVIYVPVRDRTEANRIAGLLRQQGDTTSCISAGGRSSR